jgi:hypothetical protein
MRVTTLPLIGGLIAVCAIHSAAAAPSGEIFGACASLGTLPTVYFSGVFAGPVAAGATFKAGFQDFLKRTYGYNGMVVCAPAATAAAAMSIITTQSNNLRNAKRTVIDTGWTEPAGMAAAGGAAPAIRAPANARGTNGTVAGGAGAAGAASGAGGSGAAGAAGGSPLAALLRNILSGAGGGSGSGPSSGAGAGSAKAGAGGAGSGTAVGDQLSSALGSAFKPGAGAADGAKSQPGLPDGALGAAQFQTTKLVVYGCGRQGKQVACVNELTNQNQKDTLVQAADVWKDAFIVDDRGDRHQRSNGFFLNVDGDQRSQIDLSYGKTSRFVLLFDEVQARVQKVALRSNNGGLDVEEIHLIDTGAGLQSGNQ